MKKNFYFILAALSVMAISCAKEKLADQTQTEYPVVNTFTAIKSEVKVGFDGDTKVTWEEGDYITIFSGATNKLYEYEVVEADLSEDHLTVTFTIPEAESIGAGPYYAVASMEGYLCSYSKGQIVITPNIDTYFEDSDFLVASSAGFGETSCELNFYQAVGFVKFTCTTPGVSKVHIVASDPCGASKFTCDFPKLGEAPVTTAKSINFPSVSVSGNEEYYMPIAPGEYSNFEILLNAAAGKSYGVKLPKTLNVARGHIVNLGDITSRLTEYVFYESFDGTIATNGGNDGVFANQTSETVTVAADNDGWTLANSNGGVYCAYFGSSSKLGSAQTPRLGLSKNAATVTFKAAAYYHNGGADMSKYLQVSVVGNGEISKHQFKNTHDSWTEHSFELVGADENTKIFFEGQEATRSRFFLDEVKVAEKQLDNYIGLSKTLVEVPIEGATIEYNVTCNGAWTFACPGATSVNPTSGNGNGKVTVVIPANPTYELKEYTATAQTTGYEATCDIKQAAIVDYVKLAVHKVKVDADVTSYKVSLSANTAWTAVCAGAESVTPASGTEDAEITVGLPANQLEEPVKYSLIVANTDGSIADTLVITLRPKSGEFYVKVTEVPAGDVPDWSGTYLYVCEEESQVMTNNVTSSRFQTALVVIDSTSIPGVHRIKATDAINKYVIKIARSTWKDAKSSDYTLYINGGYISCSAATKVPVLAAESNLTNWRIRYNTDAGFAKGMWFAQYWLKDDAWVKSGRFFEYSTSTSDWRTPAEEPKQTGKGKNNLPYCQLFKRAFEEE